MSPIVGSVSYDFKKSTTSIQEVIKVYDSTPGTPPKIDIATDLYFGSTPATNYDEMSPSDSNNIFRPLNT
jgi:hypothetical protein